MDIKHLLFSFKGRVNRKKYWLVIVSFLLINSFLISITAALAWGRTLEDPSPILILWYLFLAWISIAIHVKRLHDLDKSGWLILILLIPYLGALGLIIICGFLKGTAGENSFGPDPLKTPLTSHFT